MQELTDRKEPTVARDEKVERMEFLLSLRRRGISDQAVLRALDAVPREQFVLPEFAWGVVQWLPVAQDGSSTARAPFTSATPMRSSLGG